MRVIEVHLLVVAVTLLAIFLVVSVVRFADAYERHLIREEIDRRGHCSH